MISDTLSSNVAQGSANVGMGEGGGLYIAPGGSSGSYTGTIVSTSSVTFSSNVAQGGAHGGVGEGQGIYIAPPIGANGTDYVIDVDLDGDTLSFNTAQGGAVGGVGEGGAIYIATVNNSEYVDTDDVIGVYFSGDTLSYNTAQGGAAGNLGEGGGIFIGTGASAFIDTATLGSFVGNTASTSYPNIFGTYTVQ